MIYSERLAAIEQCQDEIAYWTDKLQSLRNAHQRACRLAILKDGGDTPDIWDRLTETERHDKEFIVAAISSDPGLFTAADGEIEDIVFSSNLPTQFHEDRDVLLAFARQFAGTCNFDDDSGIPVPLDLKDDREFILTLCQSGGHHFEKASEHLRDDAEIALVALANAFDEIRLFSLVSERLRTNMPFLLKVVDMFCYFAWTQHSAPLLKEEHQRDLALAIAGRCERSRNLSTVENVPLQFFASRNISTVENVPLQFFADSIRDDNEVMKKFVAVNGEFLDLCSDRLKRDETFVKTAAKIDPSSLLFARGDIRGELFNDVDFITKAINSSSLGSGRLLAYAPDKLKTDRILLLTAAKQGFSYDSLPEVFKSDEEIVLESIRPIPYRCSFNIESLREPLRTNIDFVVKCVEVGCFSYQHLPEDLKKNEKVALTVLASPKCNYLQPRKHLFENVPSLCQSRYALEALTSIQGAQSLFYELAQIASFFGEKSFLVMAVAYCPSLLLHSSEALRWDTDVVSAALGGYAAMPIAHTDQNYFPLSGATIDFLVNNIDLLVKAIFVVKTADQNFLFSLILRSNLFSVPDVMLAALAKGWNAMVLSSSETRKNRDLVRWAVQFNWNAIAFADEELKRDRDFVHSLVRVDGRVLRNTSQEMKYDYSILTAALWKSGYTVISHCFNTSIDHDFNYLVSFAGTVEDKLNCFESYLLFLRPYEGDEEASKDSTVPKCTSKCHLSLLEQDPETTAALKRTIAEFAGVPLGEELLMLRSVSSSLSDVGF